MKVVVVVLLAWPLHQARRGSAGGGTRGNAGVVDSGTSRSCRAGDLVAFEAGDLVAPRASAGGAGVVGSGALRLCEAGDLVTPVANATRPKPMAAAAPAAKAPVRLVPDCCMTLSDVCCDCGACCTYVVPRINLT